MYKNAASLISALGLYAGMAAAQGGNPIPIPAVNSQGSGGAAADCNGCYVVADVAGVVFGSETVTATQVNNVIVQTGTNGSYTTTQVNFNYGPFTFGPTAAPAATGAASAYNTDSTLVLSGVTLTSPTAYNVFTAYSLTYSTYSNGACQVVAGPSTNLPSAYSVPIPQGVNPLDYEGAAQQSFVDFVHRPTCSLGGINFAETTHVPVSVATTAVTTTNGNRATPMPVSIAATTTGPTATPTFVPLNGFNSSLATTFLPGGTGTFVVGGQTIMPGAAPRLSTVGSFFAGVVALAAGLVA